VEEVHRTGEQVIITKHGKIIARLVPEHETKPIEDVRKKLAGSVKSYRNPFKPAVEGDEIEVYK
jgi:prevent-host-death family protein